MGNVQWLAANKAFQVIGRGDDSTSTESPQIGAHMRQVSPFDGSFFEPQSFTCGRPFV